MLSSPVRRLVRRVAVLAFACIGLRPGALSAQETERFASPFLPTDHWAYAAARRLDALGLLGPGFDRGTLSLTWREAASTFEAAVRRSVEEAPELTSLAVAYRDRLVEESPRTFESLSARGPARLRFITGAAEADYRYRDGAVRAGSGYGADWTGTSPLPRLDEEGVELTLGVDVAPGFAAVVVPSITGQDSRLQEGYAVLGWRMLGAWAGRRAPGFRPGVGGGLVLNASTTVDGGGVFLADPVVLPGVLRYLGPMNFDLFLTRLKANGTFRHPWFWGARGTIRPHPRLGIGVSRAAMFGGEGNTPIRFVDVLDVLIGKHAGKGSELDNQVVSVDFSYRFPSGAVPLLLYMEWGFEDSAGAWKDVPGILAGIEVPALPMWPAASLGVERTSFAPHCCGNPIWYRHWQFDEGWTDAGVPLGHPLGGHGTEWLVHGQADVMNARLRVSARAYTRDRREENLFSPQWQGRSNGAALHVEYRATPGLEVIAGGEVEHGRTGWRRTVATAGLRALF